MVSMGRMLARQGGFAVAMPVGSQAPTLPCDLLTNSLFQLAPENTLMSLRKTAECGADVFETDVMIR